MDMGFRLLYFKMLIVLVIKNACSNSDDKRTDETSDDIDKLVLKSLVYSPEPSEKINSEVGALITFDSEEEVKPTGCNFNTNQKDFLTGWPDYLIDEINSTENAESTELKAIKAKNMRRVLDWPAACSSSSEVDKNFYFDPICTFFDENESLSGKLRRVNSESNIKKLNDEKDFHTSIKNENMPKKQLSYSETKCYDYMPYIPCNFKSECESLEELNSTHIQSLHLNKDFNFVPNNKNIKFKRNNTRQDETYDEWLGDGRSEISKRSKNEAKIKQSSKKADLNNISKSENSSNEKTKRKRKTKFIIRFLPDY